MSETVNVRRRQKWILTDPTEFFMAPDECHKPNDLVARVMREAMPHDGQEHVAVLGMDAHGAPLAVGVVASGTVDMVPLFARDIYAWALTVPRVRFVGIAHNHPSGDVTPSRPDKASSKLVAKAGKMLALDLLWSLVVNHENDAWAAIDLNGQQSPGPDGDDREPYQPKDPDDEPGPDEKDPEPNPEPDGTPNDEPDDDGDDQDGDDGDDTDDDDGTGDDDGDGDDTEDGDGDTEPEPEPGKEDDADTKDLTGHTEATRTDGSHTDASVEALKASVLAAFKVRR